MKIYELFTVGLAFAGAPLLFADSGIYVCANSQYQTIQSGVNAAAPGARIQVCAGTYPEQVTVNKSGLSLQAQGAVKVIPPVPRASYGFLVTSPNVQITGFQITGFSDRTLDAGIFVGPVTGTQLSSNSINGNCNGVIMNHATQSNLSGNNISQNPLPTGNPNGPCILLAFDNNGNQILAPDGYGVQTTNGQTNAFSGNTLNQNGQCGIQLQGDTGGSSLSSNVLFSNNGALFAPCGNIDVRGSSGASHSIDISGNNIDTGSNGVMLLNSTAITVEKNNIIRNSQGLNVVDSSRNEISKNTVDHNSTGLYLSGQNNTVEKNEFSNNDFQGIFVTPDGCPDCSVAMPGQLYLTTSGNLFSKNDALNNGQYDVEDFSALSHTQCPTTCGGPQPNPTVTLDTYDKNSCNKSIPASICAVK